MKLFFAMISMALANQDTFANSVCDQLLDLGQKQTCKKYLEKGYRAEISNGLLLFLKKNNLTISSKIKTVDSAQVSKTPASETLAPQVLDANSQPQTSTPSETSQDQKKQEIKSKNTQKPAELDQKAAGEKAVKANEMPKSNTPDVKEEKKDPSLADQAQQVVKGGESALFSGLSNTLKQK